MPPDNLVNSGERGTHFFLFGYRMMMHMDAQLCAWCFLRGCPAKLQSTATVWVRISPVTLRVEFNFLNSSQNFIEKLFFIYISASWHSCKNGVSIRRSNINVLALTHCKPRLKAFVAPMCRRRWRAASVDSSIRQLATSSCSFCTALAQLLLIVNHA